MVLETLPSELLFQIFAHILVEDIITLRCTCRSLSAVTRERSVWHDALLYHAVEADIPVHGMHNRLLFELSAAELEQVTLRALRSRRNWTSPTPQPTSIIEISTLPDGEDSGYSRTFTSYFIPGMDARYLISLTRSEPAAGGRGYTLHCWDLHAAPPACIAELSFSSLTGLQGNSEGGHDVVLTLTRRAPSNENQTVAYALDFSAPSPDAGFVAVHTFESPPSALKLAGTQFFASDDSNRIRVYNVTTGELQYVLRVPLHHNDQTVFLEEHRCLAIHIMQGYILTFCQQWSHLYALTQSRTSSDTPAEIDPIHSHRWTYRIDTLKLSARRPHPLLAQFRPKTQQQLPALDLLVRFDSWFPWPVNILHHLILSPNPSFTPGGIELPYFTHGSTPQVAAALPSPLRLFTPSDAVLGAHGTALWLDAQAGGGGPSQAGDRGQRVAGRVLRRTAAPTGQGTGRVPRHAVDLHAQAEPGAEGETMVFLCAEESEEWGRLAVCEDEGRIAVSCVDARVLVYDYT